MLARHWLRRPWLQEMAARRVLFKQIYNLRKHYGERGRPYVRDIMAVLTPKWYAVYWVEYKLCRPFMNLSRWWRKRRPPRSGRWPADGK